MRMFVLFVVMSVYTSVMNGTSTGSGRFSHLVINGVDAVDGEFPWQVSLAADGLYHFCGGSLIDERWVVTARHCLLDSDGKVMEKVETWLVVVAGVYDVRRWSWSKDAERILVKKAYVRPSDAEDIALLELSRPVNTSRPDISTIPIAASDRRFLGYMCVTSGWGQHIENVEFTDIPSVLQKTYMTVYPRYVCEYLWGRERIYSFDMCVANVDSSPCMGDSGGPLVCRRRDGTFVLAGVTSWGSDKCKKNVPVIFKRLAHWRLWIDNITQLQL